MKILSLFIHYGRIVVIIHLIWSTVIYSYEKDLYGYDYDYGFISLKYANDQYLPYIEEHSFFIFDIFKPYVGALHTQILYIWNNVLKTVRYQMQCVMPCYVLLLFTS